MTLLFNTHKIQAMELVTIERSLNEMSKVIATAVILRVIHNKSWEGFVTDKSLASYLDKSEKTISRAVKELARIGLFKLTRGERGRATIWQISPTFRERIIAHKAAPDKTVTQLQNNGGQNCPEKLSDMSGSGGQIWPPTVDPRILEEDKNTGSKHSGQLHKVAVESYEYEQWRLYLRQEFSFVSCEECEFVWEYGEEYALLPLEVCPSRYNGTVDQFVKDRRKVLESHSGKPETSIKGSDIPMIQKKQTGDGG